MSAIAPVALAGRTVARGVLPPWPAIVELAALTGLILLVDWLVTAIDLTELQPNPFWVPVLLLSLQYGTVSGMLAAAVAAAVTLHAGFPEQGIGEAYFAYLTRVWALPIAWLGTAVILGQFRLRQIAEKQTLQLEVDELSRQRTSLAEHTVNLRRRCEMLEREIASRRDSAAIGLLDRMAEVGGDSGALGVAFDDLVQHAFPGMRAVLLRQTQRQLEVATTSPPRDTAAGIGKGSRLFETLITEGRSVAIVDASADGILTGHGVAAVPVRSAVGETIGALLVKSSPAEHIDMRFLARLEALAAPLALPLSGNGATGTVTDPAAAGVAPPRQPWRQRRWLPVRRNAGAASSSRGGDAQRAG